MPRPRHPAGVHLALTDEARHVAFGLAHLEHQADGDPTLRDSRAAVEHEDDALADTAGLNDEVFDALVLLAAGFRWDPAAVAAGYRRVQQLRRK